MAESSIVKLEGFTDLITACRAVPARANQTIRTAFRAQASKVIARAAGFAQHRSGAMAAKTSTKITATRMTVTWTEPYSAVQAWATDYVRGGPHGGPVHMSNPSNFPVRARDAEFASITDALVLAVAQAAEQAGFEVTVT